MQFKRIIKPIALAAEKTQTSQIKLPLVRSSSALFQNEPVAIDASEMTKAINPANAFVQII